jgi:hypothetical protein
MIGQAQRNAAGACETARRCRQASQARRGSPPLRRRPARPARHRARRIARGTVPGRPGRYRPRST